MGPDGKQAEELKDLLALLRRLRGDWDTKVFATAMITVVTEPATVPGQEKEHFLDLLSACWDQWREPDYVPGTSN